MINKIFALPVVEQLTPVLSRRQIDGADVIVVDHPRVKASVALNGARVTVENHSDMDFTDLPVDLELAAGGRTTLLVSVPAGQAVAVDLAGGMEK